MSLAISGIAGNAPDYDLARPAAPPKPTVSQQLKDLADSGHSAQQIATTLGLTTAQVDTALGITATTVGTAPSVVAAASRLSLYA